MGFSEGSTEIGVTAEETSARSRCAKSSNLEQIVESRVRSARFATTPPAVVRNSGLEVGDAGLKMGDTQLYSDTFTLTDINAQKYDRVSRLKGNTENGDTEFTLDVNTELYPCHAGERLSLVIASTLSLDGTKDDSKGWRGVGRGEQTLADEYDYVCHGKVYRFEEGDDENM